MAADKVGDDLRDDILKKLGYAAPAVRRRAVAHWCGSSQSATICLNGFRIDSDSKLT